jgi:hypothetical protein
MIGRQERCAESSSAARDAPSTRQKKFRRAIYWREEFLRMSNDLATATPIGPRDPQPGGRAGKKSRRADNWKLRSSSGINPFVIASPAGPRARAKRSHKGWTPERRARQAALIRRWQPWLRSTGPKTAAGKARVAMNPLRHGERSRAWILRAKRIRHAIRLCARTVLLVRACARDQERHEMFEQVRRAGLLPPAPARHSHTTALHRGVISREPSGGTLYALTPPT